MMAEALLTRQEHCSNHRLLVVGRWFLLSTILASSMAFIDGSALRADLHASGPHLPMILARGSLGDPLGEPRLSGCILSRER